VTNKCRPPLRAGQEAANGREQHAVDPSELGFLGSAQDVKLVPQDRHLDLKVTSRAGPDRNKPDERSDDQIAEEEHRGTVRSRSS
jgi:hypothetical protein